MRREVDWESVFAQIPEVMGLPELRLHGHNWYGPYYMDGSKSDRRDKFVVMKGRKGDGMITVAEQGGVVMTLVSWLIRYGGVNQKDVYRFLSEREHRTYVPKENEYSGPARTVEKWRYIEAMGRKKQWSNPLFLSLSDVWNEERVTEAFWKYGITDGLRDRKKGIVGTRFWYISNKGEILFDKTMFYKTDGHRDKELHPMRQYKVSDGYSRVCYFGAHLIKDDGRPIMIMESEKSALICSIQFPEYHWVACGGLKCLLRLIDTEKYDGHQVWLVPDVDGAQEWEKVGRVWKWWEKCKPGIVGPKWDLADLVMKRYGR